MAVGVGKGVVAEATYGTGCFYAAGNRFGVGCGRTPRNGPVFRISDGGERAPMP